MMDNTQKIRLAEVLKNEMKARNLTVTQVAQQIGMNKSTLHNYCNGVVPRNLMKMKELADFFSLSLSDLIFGSAMERSESSAEMDFEGQFEVTVKRIRARGRNDQMIFDPKK